jgi:hypothetical protein
MTDYPNYAALSEAMIDDILADSFPASDPPSWTLGREPQSYVRDGGDLPKNNENSGPNA